MRHHSLLLAPLLLVLTSAGPQETDPVSLRPVSRQEPWWVQRHTQKLAELEARRGEIDLVFLGDSITHGWESETARPLWESNFGLYEPFNLGYSGDCTEHLIWRLQNGEVQGLAPRLTVVMIGTNNAGWRQEEPRHTAAGVRGVLKELEERLPNSRVLLLAIFPRGADDEDPLRKLNRRTNELLAELADGERVVFLDLAPHFLEPDGTLSTEVMPDLLHPDVAGYRRWAKGMLPTVRRMIEGPDGEDPGNAPADENRQSR